MVETLSAVALHATIACTDDASIVGSSPLHWAILYYSLVSCLIKACLAYCSVCARTRGHTLYSLIHTSVYDSCAHDLVSHLVSGFSATVLAYGETGAGTTYTMCGPANSYRARGIIPRAIAQVREGGFSCLRWLSCW